MNDKYKCVTTVEGIKEYIGDNEIVAFDYETAPLDAYRNEEKAALDPGKSRIVGCSFSVAIGTGIYVPIAHKVGENIPTDKFYTFLKAFLTNERITKVVHNISFESAFSYESGIIILPPVYDTICAAQMSVKNAYDFRNLHESSLKRLAEELCHEPLPTFLDVTAGRFFDELDGHDTETIHYGCADSDFALRLYYMFTAWFERYLPKHGYIVREIESPTAVYLGIMKKNGIPVDTDMMDKRKAEAMAEMERIRGEISFIIGDVPIGANCATQAFK